MTSPKPPSVPKEVTPARVRALEYLDGKGEVKPAELARALYPDSPAWKRRTRRSSTPAGGALGATMPMIAGRLLAGMHRAGLVRYGERDFYAFTISPKGRRILEEERSKGRGP